MTNFPTERSLPVLFFCLLPLKGVRATLAQPTIKPAPQPRPESEPQPLPEPEPTLEPVPDRCSTNLVFDAATTIGNNLYFFKDG